MSKNNGNGRVHLRQVEDAAAALAAYGPELHRLVVRRVRNKQDAEDLMQEIFLGYLGVDQKTVVGRPKAYLFRIAFNLLGDYWRRHYRNPVHADSDAVDRITESPAENRAEVPEGDELRNDMRFQLGHKMPEAYRTTLTLLFEDKLSYKEVADQMGISVSTVKKYRRKGLAWLSEHGRE